MSHAITLAEVEDYDSSEEQFASSLAGRESHEDGEQELASGSLASARERYARVLPDIAVEVPNPDLPLTNTPDPEESWRQEVSSRIQSYKARRRRSLGDESMSFNFESTTGNHVFLRPERGPEPEPVAHEERDPISTYYAHPYATAPAIEPEYTSHEQSPEQSMDQASSKSPASTALPELPLPPPVPETAKLIFFPKPPMMQEAPADQLADPVFNMPRIVEAPEANETVTVPLADITLQPETSETCVPYIEPLLELPIPVAPVPQRAFAELMDSLLVAIAASIFAFVVLRLGAGSILAEKRSLLGMAVLVPAMFWSIYKYIFLVHGGITPGMKIAQLRLVSFDGGVPAAAPRRHRALAMLISAFPLGLGLLWSFVDTETLCWHDRISRTYVTAR